MDKKEDKIDKLIKYWTSFNTNLGKILFFGPIIIALLVVIYVGIKFKDKIIQQFIGQESFLPSSENESIEKLDSAINYSKIPHELHKWIDILKNEMKPSTKRKLLDMKETELILLHRGYGMYIRNKWLWGNRNPELTSYFLRKGINHPDTMSMELIKYLWHDIQKDKKIYHSQ
ncbi:DUF6794 domain-containing protein [Halobacteriovorax sp. GFR7]|uniref:DUF6794 domain-containing protein n=1 Tax=unclassified Halobacteriovorax TaxID=2639665 RepID=UPI003D9595B8